MGSEHSLPAGHEEQEVCEPRPLVWVPGAQVTGGAVVLAQLSPATQAVQVATPRADQLPEAQFWGVADVDAQDCPAGHSRQKGEPAGEYCGSEQATGAAVGSSQELPAGQVEQEVWPVFPLVCSPG